MGKGFSDFTYGVGLELNATSFKQIKDELKLNLDNLSKMVKSYGKVLKIDPNADLSKLFDEVRKIQSIVNGINSSDNSFAGFVDKGVLSRIASLEDGLSSVSETSKEIESNLSGLKTSINSIVEPLKAAGQIKFPATFENLFGNVKDQSIEIQKITGQIEKLDSSIKTLEQSKSKFKASYDVELGESTSTKQIKSWLNEFQSLQKKISEGPKTNLNELYSDILRLSELGQKLQSTLGTFGEDIFTNLGIDWNGKSGNVFSDFLNSIPKQIDNVIAQIKKEKGALNEQLSQLKVEQTTYTSKLSAQVSSGRSLGIAKNEDGNNLTLRAKIIPDTTASEWISKINGTIKEIEPQLTPVKLTPTFSNSSKNLTKEVDGNLANINHAINVDLKVTDNIEQFNQKIQNIDKSIKNARQQLEKEGNFKIKFEYEEGGKFKDVAYKIINQFKQIEAKIYIANGKKFIQDITGLKEKAKSELKDIPANITVSNQNSIFTNLDGLRDEISKKIGTISVNLELQNVPQFMAQAALMRDTVEKYYTDNPVGTISGPNSVITGTGNVTKGIADISAKAQDAQAKIELIKNTLKSLTTMGFKSPDFLKLGAFDENSKHIKGSKSQLKQLIQEYDELSADVYASKEKIKDTYGITDEGYAAYEKDLSRLQEIEKYLNTVVQSQIQYSQKRLESAEKILSKETQIAKVKKEQTKSNTQQSTTDINSAIKKQEKLNSNITRSKQILDDLNKNGINSTYFSKIGDWDKESESFKKNSQYMQELISKYKELKNARVASGSDVASKEELSLRNQLGTILQRQKKHIAEIITENQTELKSIEQVLTKEQQVEEVKRKQAKVKTTDSSIQKSTQQLAMSAEEATKKIRSLNGTLTQQKRTLKDLETNKLNASSLVKLGEWDKKSNSFKKNSQEMQTLVNRYKELREARIAAGGKTATGEEASLRGKLSAILREQKKHVSEIIAQNQKELETTKQISAEYKQINKSKTRSSNSATTKSLDELISKLTKAKETLELLKSNKFDAVGKTGLGDINKRLEAAGSKQSFQDLIKFYNQLITKKNELESSGKTGSNEYIQLAKYYQNVENLLSVIYQDQLKYTQSRISGLETEIAKEKELLQIKTQQTKESSKQKASTSSTNKTPTNENTNSVTTKFDNTILATLKSIDSKINSITAQLGKGIVITSDRLNVNTQNVSINSTSGLNANGRQNQPPVIQDRSVNQSGQAKVNQEIAVSAESATRKQKELNDELTRTQEIAQEQSSSMAVVSESDGNIKKLVNTYKSQDKVTEVQEISKWITHGKDDPGSLEHTSTIYKTNMEAYNRLYQNFIKSLAKQKQIEEQIVMTNGPTSKLQEELKVQKEITNTLESQLKYYTELYTQEAKQAAIVEATKKANQEIAKSAAAQSDKNVNKQNSEITRIVDEAQKKLNEMQYTMSNFKFPMADSAVAKFKEYEQLLTILKTKQQEIVDNPSLLKNADYSKSFNELLLKMENVQEEFETLQKSSEDFLSKIKSAEDIKPLESTFDATNLTQLHNEMQAFADQAGAGAAKLIEFNDVERTATFEIQNGRGQVQQLTVAYDEATNSLGRFASKTKTSVSETQRFFDSIKHSFGNVARYVASFGSVYQLFSIIRQGVTYVKEIDSALTELKKVTDETDQTYQDFLQTASQTASVIGSNVADFTNATADFARLGYSIDEAANLAKSASVYKNVGDGIEDVSQASESIISTMKAFGIEANDAMGIVDRFNEVGNNFAISSTGIGEAMQRSASALYEAGNTIDESIGLITGANSVIQDPEQVGECLPTIK